MDTCYIKETPYSKNKAEAYYQHVYASEYSCIIIIFYAIIYICKPGAINGLKSNFILTFLLEGCLVYQIYQVQYLQSHKPSFRGYKIIK